MKGILTDSGFERKSIRKGSEVLISVESGPATFPFQLMRQSTVKGSKSERMGAIETITILSRPAQKLLALLEKSRAKNDLISVIDKPVSRTESNSRSKAFLELRKAKLVKRARGHHTYMFSPDFLIPSGDDVEVWVEFWNSLNPMSETLEVPKRYW